MKVVFHIDELEKWEESTKNVKNLVKIAPEIDTVILVNGIAINGFLEEKHLSFIKMSGVHFHACDNALHANNITKEQLPENVVIVPAGVLDLIELQSVGYAYIKP